MKKEIISTKLSKFSYPDEPNTIHDFFFGILFLFL